MARFPRPQGAIENYSDLNVGDHVFHVYGIWPPQFGCESVVTSAPAPFATHREYSDIHSGSADATVFDAMLGGSKYPSMEFANDGNLVPGHSHNDNYWFRSEEQAMEAVAFLRKRWEANPSMIAEENIRREIDRKMDAYFDDYSYAEEPA